jgi:sulfate adenylyltransferase
MLRQSIPHGGSLINRLLEGEAIQYWAGESKKLPSLTLSPRALSDLELIATGAFSPLQGFLTQADYRSVVQQMRLANGLPWTLPISLAITRTDAAPLREGYPVALRTGDGALAAILHLEELYSYDRHEEAKKVYRTEETAHPGVAVLMSQGELLAGGKIDLLQRTISRQFPHHHLDPAQTRQLFTDKGWKRIVAFQTRNPIHRAHEYIQKCALETVDGLLVHPIVGEVKGDDLPAELRMRCYTALLDNYYPKDRTVLSVFPAAMRYAGPREAIFHALARKNYGCTHFIVGRDHAGVGNYYGTYDAQQIFFEFTEEELGIRPLFFDHTFYCRKCLGVTSSKTCPHDSSYHVVLSGTKVREMLRAGQMPPAEFTRPEIAQILIDGIRQMEGRSA